jgi:magnesium transporter
MAEIRPSNPDVQLDTKERVKRLKKAITQNAPSEAAALLAKEEVPIIVDALVTSPPPLVVAVLWKMSDAKRDEVLGAAPAQRRDQWQRNHSYPTQSVGRLMGIPHAVFTPEQTVDQAVAGLRTLVQKSLITYGYVVDHDGRLVGVLIFRELLFARGEQLLSDVMLPNPFALNAEMGVEDAMLSAVTLHFPEYPVVDGGGRLIGLLRGQTLFQQQAFQLSAQPGQMVGVEAEERLTTPWHRSLRFRHPWLQLNLVTAFAAAAVVGVFQDTIDKTVLLAAFLPVLAGQSGNTGCQALAVTLRGMTLGEMKEGNSRTIAMKEMLLGFLNGILVGVTAGAGMFAYATWQGNPEALTLAVVVFMAMVLACIVSGVAGTLIPVVLKRLGADPATASSIFLTTATDVVSMGVFLGLAQAFVD